MHKLCETIKQLWAFVSLLRLIWIAASALATTSAVTGVLTLTPQVADLATQVANLTAGNFPNGISLGGDLIMNGHTLAMGNSTSITSTGGGDFHTNGGNVIDRQNVTLAFP